MKTYPGMDLARTKLLEVLLKGGTVGQPETILNQATTGGYWDSKLLDASTNMKFFENIFVQGQPYTQFYTNLQQNRLPKGEALAIKRIKFVVVIATALLPGTILDVTTLNAAAIPGLYASVMTLSIANSTKIKPTPLSRMASFFSPGAAFADQDIMTLENPIVLPPEMNFTVELTLPTYVAVANTYLQCHIEGLGIINSPSVPL